jgi:hypothetical protein
MIDARARDSCRQLVQAAAMSAQVQVPEHEADVDRSWDRAGGVGIM